MPGVPKSQACKNCKVRKVRCDLNWPTCGRCKRANKECPGPSTMFKWIEDSSSSGSSPPADEASTPTTGTTKQSPAQHMVPEKSPSAAVANKRASPISIVSINSKGLSGGGSYGLFRLSSGPRAPPTTSADRLAAQLVRHLKGPQKEIFSNICYFECIPNRLSLSPALRDAVALFCCSWCHVQRGASAVELSKYVAEPYIKAIRSVRRALNDPHELLRTETLAATSVLERFDVLFNPNRQMHNTVHSQGICSLLLKRGPPDLSDDLDMRLCIENQSVLLPYWVSEGGENFYLEKDWSEAMDASRERLLQSDELGFLRSSFGMDRIADHWPSAIHEKHNIVAHLGEPDSEDKIDALLARLNSLLHDIEHLGGDIVDRAADQGLIKVVPSAVCPGGYAYDFTKSILFSILAAYLLFKTLFLKMISDLSIIAGKPIGHLTDELSLLCRQLCMLIPYVLSIGPIASTLLATIFYIPFAMGTKEEADYCLKFVKDADRFMQRLPKDPARLSDHILATFSGLVGQVPFEEIKKQRKERGDDRYSYVEGDLEL